MKKTFFFFAGLISTLGLSAQNNWTQIDSINGSVKTVCAAFATNAQGYVVSGLESNGFTRKMYSYDAVQNDWDNEESMGGVNGGGLSRGSAVAFSAFGKGYVCTGQGDNTDFLNDNWEYDPALEVWTQKADFPGTARRSAVAFVIDEIAYVGTGEDVDGYCNDFYKYDASTNTWGAIAAFAGTARKQAVGFSIGSQGYVGTGNDGIMKNDFWQYQVFQNAWVQKANFPGTAREGACGWGIFPSGFIACGEDLNFDYKSDVWEYNYFTNQWTQRASLPAAGRKDAVAFVLNNIAFVGTGFSGILHDDFYAYTGIVGTEEISATTELNVYPNPSTDKIRFQNSIWNTNNSVEIFDIEGKECIAQTTIQQFANVTEIDVRNLSSGTYFVITKSEKGISFMGKFIKQ
jgi:N-acetylneuraminic acid mutarotase